MTHTEAETRLRARGVDLEITPYADIEDEIVDILEADDITRGRWDDSEPYADRLFARAQALATALITGA